MSLILALGLLCQEDSGGRFFTKRDVNFWNARRPAPIPPLWSEPMPEPVRELLEQPTVENAARYLAWQKARVERLQKAIDALEEAKAGGDRKDGPVLQYFSQPGCPYCAEQDKVLSSLKGVSIVRVSDREIWKKYRVTATPTLVLEGKGREPKIWRGFVSRARLEKELFHADR